MSSLSYASVGSGPSAGGIGWINLGNFSIVPNTTIPGISVTLLDGSIMTFDLTNTLIAGDGFTIDAITTPVYPDAAFGTLGYTNISGNVGLQTFNPYVTSTSSTKLTLSNISVKDSLGNPVENFTFLAANVETTNSNGNANSESQEYTTDGAPWKLFTWIGNTASPVVTGLEGNIILSSQALPMRPLASINSTNSTINTITMVGVSDDSGAPIFTTESPTEVSATLISTTGLQAVVFGVAITSVKLMKYITERVFPSDQFTLFIEGNPNDSATTTGNDIGLQPEIAHVYGYAGNIYIINEAITTDSGCTLCYYSQYYLWQNLTPGGTPVPYGRSVVPALGDIFVATLINKPKPSRGVNLFKK